MPVLLKVSESKSVCGLKRKNAEACNYMEQDYSTMENECVIVASIQLFHENGKIKFDKGFLLDYTLTVLQIDTVQNFIWSVDEQNMPVLLKVSESKLV